MRRFICIACVLAALFSVSAQSQAETWSFKAEDIEACSCDLFCNCYWTTTPQHGFCRFNMAYKISEGHYGETKLDGMKFWISGDLGDDFGDGEAEIVQFAFEPEATQKQVDGVLAILGELFPVTWKQVVGVERTTIEWTKEDDKAYAKRGDGKGEVEITFVLGSDGKTPVVINNLTYFGAKKNNGFHLARSKHHAKVGEDSFEFDGRTGFLIEVETSGTVK